jgi:hypothetical protein
MSPLRNILFACSTLILLAGCATFNNADIPPPPPPTCAALGMPVKAPPIAEGDDVVVDLAQHRAALMLANKRIVKRDQCEVSARKAVR